MSTGLHRFGAGLAEGLALGPARLGGKGHGLAHMAALGLPVPPGFTIALGAGPDLTDAIAWLEEASGRRLGDPEAPLLLSVRSGAPVSMPGMMETVLNIGLTAPVLEAFRARGQGLFAAECRRRLVPAIAEAALGIERDFFDDALEDALAENALFSEADLDEAAAFAVLDAFDAVIAAEADTPLPDTPHEHLAAAIAAVHASYHAPRARRYRAIQDLPEDGTAITVQRMVFGNLDDNSATGVVFTRDPSTGAPGLYGEYLPRAQGEDLVAGVRTPRALSAMAETMPQAHADLAALCARLEAETGDMQDIEFTVERGAVWLLQTRTARRTGRAALRIAVDLAGAGVIDRDEALLRVEPRALDQLLHPTVDPSARREVVGRGLPASPGAVTGEIVFTAEEAEALKGKGRNAILVRVETSPEDIHGMYAASGVLTARGGMTSHAAVVARGLGRPCICGAGDMRVDVAAGTLRTAGGKLLRRGDILTIDGGAGEALLGAVPMVEPAPDAAFETLMGWADARRTMGVRANADTPEEARIARRLGAIGIGLCRTEQSFFQKGRIHAMREMIIAETESGRRAALDKLLPMQRDDFIALFEEMRGQPVVIRLLDPPLHEFLPHTEAEVMALARSTGAPMETIQLRTAELREFNPMLGRRGCRLGIAYPEIYETQARAIFEAAVAAGPVTPEIMIPLVTGPRELELLKARIDAVAGAVRAETGASFDHRVGVMIETPRAALRAGQIAAGAAFMSFGTNDLTQMTYGLSRDDAGRFMRDYVAKGALPADPFHSLDEEGVGELMALAVARARAARSDVGLGVCGEHGADPVSLRFFQALGLHYVSCSPYRVPIARLAAAQAAVMAARGGDDV